MDLPPFTHIYDLIAEAKINSMLDHYGIAPSSTATYQEKSETLANIIGTQAASGPLFYLPERIGKIEIVLSQHTEVLSQHTEVLSQHTEVLRHHTDITEVLSQHTEVLRHHTGMLNYHTDIFKALFKHLGVPFPEPPPTPPASAQPGA